MEEAVTRKFVHADSSSVSSLCGEEIEVAIYDLQFVRISNTAINATQ